MSDANRIVNKLWSYCNALRDDGLSYGCGVRKLWRILSGNSGGFLVSLPIGAPLVNPAAA